MKKLKYRHEIGKQWPLPMMVTKDALSENGHVRLGVINPQNAVVVESDVELPRFIGELYRNLPTPSLLEGFMNGLVNRASANNLTEYPKAPMLETYMGAAGVGKTFQAELTGRLTHEGGAMLVGCGAKDMRTLLFETVVDKPKSDSLFAKIDFLLQKYNADSDRMHSPLRGSVITLQKSLGEAFTEENGRVGIDWDLAAEKEILLSDKAQKALDFVAKANNLDKVEASSLGLKTVEGPLIRAWKEGRPIILDEYNKSKEGSDNGLQNILQFLAGEVSTVTVEGEGQRFTFDKKDKKPGFFVTITGNETKDGITTHTLSQSAYSRIQPVSVSDPNKLDWEHRISQTLTGLPITTLWRCQEDFWIQECAKAQRNNQPNPFAKWCRKVRLAGLTPEEQRRVPEAQLVLIDHYATVLNASSQLADFYLAWSKALDPDPVKATDYTDEIDEEYSKSVGLNMRMMMNHINAAMRPRAEGSDGAQATWNLDADFDKPIQPSRPKRFEPLEHLGTNLMKVISETVDNKTNNNDPDSENRKNNLREYLYTVMRNTGIVPSDKQGALQGGVYPLSALLDIHIERVEDKYKDSATLLCEDLRSKYPELEGQEDDNIVPLAAFISMYEKMQAESKGNSDEPAMVLPNSKTLEDFADQPIDKFQFSRNTDEYVQTPVDSDEITKSQFLIGLTFPDGEKIFENVLATKKAKGDDPSFFLNEGESQNKGDPIYTDVLGTSDGNLYLVYNGRSKEALIVGEGEISDNLSNALASKNITYMARDNSASELDKAYERVVGGKGSEFISYINEDLGSAATKFSQAVGRSRVATTTLFLNKKER